VNLLLQKTKILERRKNKTNLKLFAKGFSNSLYTFHCQGNLYIYRKTTDPSLKIPKIYYYQSLFKSFFSTHLLVLDNALIYPFIEGTPLNPYQMSVMEEEKAISSIGTKYKKIHNVTYSQYLYKGKKFGSWQDLFSYKMEEIQNLKNKHYISKLKEQWANHFGEYKPKKRLLHGDFSPRNIIISDSTLKIIDWDKFIVGDRFFELVNFLSKMFVRSHGNFEMSLIVNAFFSAYGWRYYSELTKNKRLYLIYSLYFLIEMYSRCVMAKSHIRARQYKNRIEYLFDKLRRM